MALPEAISCSAIGLASSTGIAKPMPMLPLWSDEPRDEPREAMAELIPISWPLALTRAPPLLPGLIAALVWMAFVTTGSADCWLKGSVDWAAVVTGRLRALTIPVV